ncbi:hypothetical protein Goshw_005229 [Gossypium schwendimanii]|uniref:Uncharacterized protein n=1 Tax=Gossypium schwendimanii TaxID=34291 RepID=A0A7J9L7U3_GOSSC|nr:hypothetical protein [Gossypium schwendimanii]
MVNKSMLPLSPIPKKRSL